MPLSPNGDGFDLLYHLAQPDTVGVLRWHDTKRA
jgi:hypothetical protein